MNATLLERLISGGEKTTVDFKLTCNAFNRAAGDQEKARAELVKDICAMANNGSSASYLIIGVGDDGKTVRPVSDANLTNQNIQTLVRAAIHPRPDVRLHRVTLCSRSGESIPGVVIQVGPSARHAFRLARDYIDFKERYHFRKNEVWVRNGDTSDLATPEQIGRLMGIRRLVESGPAPDFKVVEYQKLALADQLPALAQDVKNLFREMGAKFGRIAKLETTTPWQQDQFRVSLRIRGRPFVFRCEFLRRLTAAHERDNRMSNCWSCEHGVMTFVLGNFTTSAKFWGLLVDSEHKWGSLNVLAIKRYSRFSRNLPDGFAETSFSMLTFSNLRDTIRLREFIGKLVSDLDTDDVLFNHLLNARQATGTELRRWARKSAKALRNSFPSSEPASTFSNHVRAVLNLEKGRLNSNRGQA